MEIFKHFIQHFSGKVFIQRIPCMAGIMEKKDYDSHFAVQYSRISTETAMQHLMIGYSFHGWTNLHAAEERRARFIVNENGKLAHLLVCAIKTC